MDNKWIYFAGPLFTRAEIDFNLKVSGKLEDSGYRVFLPQRECEGLSINDIYKRCIEGVDGAHLVMAILDGTDADSGTSFEVGYAKAKNIPIIGVRTDFRQTGDDVGLNLMLSKSCEEVLYITGDNYIEIILEKLKNYIQSSH